MLPFLYISSHFIPGPLDSHLTSIQVVSHPIAGLDIYVSHQFMWRLSYIQFPKNCISALYRRHLKAIQNSIFINCVRFWIDMSFPCAVWSKSMWRYGKCLSGCRPIPYFPTWNLRTALLGKTFVSVVWRKTNRSVHEYGLPISYCPPMPYCSTSNYCKIVDW